jgi:hypothetical protein
LEFSRPKVDLISRRGVDLRRGSGAGEGGLKLGRLGLKAKSAFHFLVILFIQVELEEGLSGLFRTDRPAGAPRPLSA